MQRSTRCTDLITRARELVQHAQTVPDDSYIARQFEEALLFLRINPGLTAHVYCALRPSLRPLLEMFSDAGLDVQTTHMSKTCPGDNGCVCRNPVQLAVSIPMPDLPRNKL